MPRKTQSPLEAQGVDLHAIFDDLIKRSGQNRSQLSKELGITESILSRVANRERLPTLEVLALLAAHVGRRVVVETRKS